MDHFTRRTLGGDILFGGASLGIAVAAWIAAATISTPHGVLLWCTGVLFGVVAINATGRKHVRIHLMMVVFVAILYGEYTISALEGLPEGMSLPGRDEIFWRFVSAQFALISFSGLQALRNAEVVEIVERHRREASSAAAQDET